MNKVGILSIHYGTWMPGPSLQAASLSYAIRQLGYEVEHIDFIPKRNKPVSKSVLKVQFRNRFAKNPEVFEDFRKEWVPRSSHVYRTLEDLEQGEFNYDIVIVGSDSVWAPSATGEFLPAYFLHFLNDKKVRKIAYSASFGQTDWDVLYPSPELEKMLKKYLKNFSAIGLRESYGVLPLRNIVNVAVENVLEPTLLLDKQYFQQMLPVNPISAAPEIAYHKILKDDTFREKLNIIEKSYLMSSENIYNYERLNSDNEKQYFYNTMDEWLFKIANCKLVLTDSFHCLCMAIHFEKEFYFLPAEEEIKLLNRPSRDILSKLNLMNRVCFDTKDVQMKIRNNSKIVYEIVNSRLAKEKLFSHNFLKMILKDE
ncbi:polysaccharide pyruvyl transferase family protein [Desulfopila sp. IMCC35008]|uniref:polysaccharide pyruvyl transferase family protein n=1 Tax=Desulfopila sp. IMCC35008 TaxID=2653858 RepID=UPI0013D87FC5|nr:polysaccharide pyruvyl transferase family protein [Desulfopila sp. IMCC35008]